MKLKAWLLDQKPPITRSAFAQRIGRDPATVTKIIKGHVTPDSTTMRRIIDETGGAVQPNDFFDLPDAPEILESLPTQPIVSKNASKSSKASLPKSSASLRAVTRAAE